MRWGSGSISPPPPFAVCYAMTRAGGRCKHPRPIDFAFCGQHADRDLVSEIGRDMGKAELECEWLGLDIGQVEKFYGSVDHWRDLEEQAERTVGSKVYVLVRGDEVKIGFTRDLERRMAALGHTCADVLATIPGGRQTEQRLHKRLAHLRIRGEWFRVTDELLDVITCEVEGRVT